MGNTTQSCCDPERKTNSSTTASTTAAGSKPHITVRRARNAAEVRACHYAWAEDEHWCPGVNETDVFFELDTQGWFIAEVDGVPAACVMAIRFSTGWAWLSYYICKKEFRGKGAGLAVWQYAFKEHLVGCEGVGLDAVQEQMANYAKSGFVSSGTQQVRWQGVTLPSYEPLPSAASMTIVPATSIDEKQPALYANLLKFLDAHDYAPRSEWIVKRWQTQPDAITAARIDGDRVLGYVVLRPASPAGSGWRIGPCWTDTVDTAHVLMNHVLSKIPAGTEFWLDAPSAVSNAPSVRLCSQDYGMKEYAIFTRMYYGKSTNHMPLANIFALLGEAA